MHMNKILKVIIPLKMRLNFWCLKYFLNVETETFFKTQKSV